MAPRASGWPVLQSHSPPVSATELDGSLPSVASAAAAGRLPLFGAAPLPAGHGAATFAGAPVLAAAWSPPLDTAGRRLLVAGTRALDHAPCGCGGGSPVGCVQVYRRGGGEDPALEVAALLAIPARGCKVLAWAPFADGETYVRLAAALSDGTVYVFALEVTALQRLLDADTNAGELAGGALAAAAVKEMVLPSRRILADRAEYSTQSLLWLPKSESLLIGRFDGTVSMLEVRANADGGGLEQEVEVRWCTRAHDGAVVSLCLAGDNLLVSGGTDCALRTRDMRRPSVVLDEYNDQSGWPTHVVRLDGQSSVCIAYTSSAGALRVLLVGRAGPARGYPRQEAIVVSSANLQRGPLQALAYVTRSRLDGGASDFGETEEDSLHFLLASGTHGLVHEVPLVRKAAEFSDAKSQPGYWRIGRAVRVVGAWRSVRGEPSPLEKPSALVDRETAAVGECCAMNGEAGAKKDADALLGGDVRRVEGCEKDGDDSLIADGICAGSDGAITTAAGRPKRVTFAENAEMGEIGDGSDGRGAREDVEPAPLPAATADGGQVSGSARFVDNLLLAVDITFARAKRRQSNLLSEVVPDLMAGQHGHWGEKFDERVNVTSLALDLTSNFLVASTGGGFLALTKVLESQSITKKGKDSGRSAALVPLHPLPESLQLSSQSDWPIFATLRHGSMNVASSKRRSDPEKRAALEAKKRERDAKKAAAAAKAAEKKKAAEAARAAKAAKIEEEEKRAAEQQRLFDARMEAHIAKTMARKKELAVLKASQMEKKRQETERSESAVTEAARLAKEAATRENQVSKAQLEGSKLEEMRLALVSDQRKNPHLPAKKAKAQVEKEDASLANGNAKDVPHRSMELEGSDKDVLQGAKSTAERDSRRGRKRKAGKGGDLEEENLIVSSRKRLRSSVQPRKARSSKSTHSSDDDDLAL